MPTSLIVSALLGLAVGIVGMIIYQSLIRRNKISKLEAQAQESLNQAQKEEQNIIREAKNQSQKLLDQIRREELERKRKLQELEQKNQKQEHEVERQLSDLTHKQKELDTSIDKLRAEEGILSEKKKSAEELLQKISSLSPAEAKEILFKKVEEEYQEDLVKHTEKIIKESQAKAEVQVKNILAEAMQRYHGESIAESTVTTVTLPNDEMKGRVIGREGRNINAFEKLSGVDVIVDDSPGVVILSGFDLIRRYIAKVALERLVADGRIHPTRIEEMLAKSEEDVNKMIKEFGEKVAYELGITGFPAEILKLLGRLRFRTAYGQNVLKHSVEVAKLASNIAAEMGANVDIAKKAGLLHDIGKALDQEIEGHHSDIGREICKKYNINPKVIAAIESHHGNTSFSSVEGIIVYIANILSQQRLGAKREGLEQHIQRMTNLEQLALNFEGVEKAFAVQAGHEVRVIVNPLKITDLSAYKLAHDLAKKLEKETDITGEIKVNVVRETRIIEYAR